MTAPRISPLARPYFVRPEGHIPGRRFGTLARAQAWARQCGAGGSIFFEVTPGTGHFLERF